MKMKKVTDVKKLPDFVKRFIVRCHAGFEEIERIEALVAEYYDLEITPDQLLQIHPEQELMFILDEEWDEYFHQEREKVLTAVLHVPIGSKFLRVQWLQQLYDMYKEKGNPEMCLKVVEAANAETGPLYKKLVDMYKDLKDGAFNAPEFKA